MDETRRVGRSLIVLLAALLLVYVIFFDVRGDLTQESVVPLSVQQAPQVAQVQQIQQIDQLQQRQQPATVVTVSSSPVVTRPAISSTTTADTSVTQWTTPVVASPAPVAPVLEDFDGKKFFSTSYLFNKPPTPVAPTPAVATSPSTVPNSTTSTTCPEIVCGAQQCGIIWNSCGNQKDCGPCQVQAGQGQSQTQVQTQTTTPAVAQATVATDTDVKDIPNTRLREGNMDLLDKLNLEDDVKYIRKDVNNTHYIYLWAFDENISDIVTFLWGISVDITDQIAIQNSYLMGNKVTDITLPSYKKNLKKLLLITFENQAWGSDVWLLQIDKDYYDVVVNKQYVRDQFSGIY